MNYQSPTQQRYAELHAEARIERDSAKRDLADIEQASRLRSAELNRVRATRRFSSEVAHEALDRLAGDAQAAADEDAALFAGQAVGAWIHSLTLPDPAPMATVSGAWLLKDPVYVEALHARIDQIADDTRDSALHSRTLATVDAEIETLRSEIEQINAAKNDARERLDRAVRIERDYENGKVRI